MLPQHDSPDTATSFFPSAELATLVHQCAWIVVLVTQPSASAASIKRRSRRRAAPLDNISFIKGNCFVVPEN
jgi:hypothetical protein